MDNSEKPYCIMPWVHLHVTDKGQVKSCCVAPITYGNIHTDNINSIWNGAQIQELRQKFLLHNVDKRCHVCIAQEKAGAKSIREETWEKFHALNKFPIITKNLPTYFDIRFSNLCNFRCRTCWFGASSKWHAESVELKRTKSSQALINNIDDFDQFIKDYGKALLGAKEIYFAGGEPLITENHYKLLEWLIDNNVVNCLLRYNTNFSSLTFKKYNAINLWEKFNNIEILASIDAHEELGEYIRKDMDWEIILENYKSIQNMHNVNFKIAPTISILSIFHLPKLYRKALALNLIEKDGIYFNILERPFYYNIKSFNAVQKKIITQEYKQFYIWANLNHVPKQIIERFKSCIDFMNQEDLSKHWPQFVKETKIIDELRQEKLMAWWYDDLKLTNMY